MVLISDYEIDSLGTEPKEILGFQTDDELETALKPLMEICNTRREDIYINI